MENNNLDNKNIRKFRIMFYESLGETPYYVQTTFNNGETWTGYPLFDIDTLAGKSLKECEDNLREFISNEDSHKKPVIVKELVL